MLKKNKNNRPLSPSVIKRYSKSMKDGKWTLNGQAIILDADDNLLDGQHRLEACVEAGTSFTTLLTKGVSREVAFATMDTGRKRTPADILAMMGSIDHKATSTAIRMLIRYKRTIHNIAGDKGNPEAYEVATFFEEHPEIETAAEISGGLGAKLKPIIAPHVAVAVIYMAMELGHDEETLKNFFTRLRDGTGLEVGDPIFTLRERMFKEAREKRRSDAFGRMLFVIRAFNAHVGGKQLRQLIAIGRNGELPRIVGAEK